ncbi:MAG: hypothetical protein IBJ04_09035 [Hydrogenophaga sp.]|uniref:BPSS1780 family membrane protein n=1 Tax=Hydrogenophaga sp. TaxID=1904254 RepID=UPI002579F9A1|nr:BPSS1780 family membrane protein [Hydrogenophaga sp.]MBL0944454.1 hypothetical protein [Hydrogenophaga sp.]
MRLHVNTAGTGWQWVKRGMRTFFRQPLALTGLFFMFMVVASLLSLVPVVGTALSLVLVPAATLGLMAATREAEQKRFPMPTVLALAFRGGPERTRAMLVLGGLYAIAVLAVITVANLFSGPAPLPAPETGDMGAEAMGLVVRPGMLAAMLLYLPVSLAFWHAPPLVYWHGVKPAKSLFFSLVACWGNKGALTVFTLGWMGVFMAFGLALGLISSLLGGAAAFQVVLYPLVLLMAAMFHTSLWFSFRDSFRFDDEATDATDSTAA